MKIGMQELLLVFIVALIVLGPDKLPLYARKFGEALREFRKFSSDATKDIRESIVEPLEEAQRPLKEALEPIAELQKEVRGDVEGIQKSFSDIGKPVKKETEEKEPQGKEGERGLGDDRGSADILAAGGVREPVSVCEAADAREVADAREPVGVREAADAREPVGVREPVSVCEPADVRESGEVLSAADARESAGPQDLGAEGSETSDGMEEEPA